MKQFEIGKTYTSKCIGDHEITVDWEIVSRTAKTITIREAREGTKRMKVLADEHGEFALPLAGFGAIRA